MFTSWRLAKILGIDLFIHWTFWLLPVWIVFTRDDASFLPIWLDLLTIGCLFVCVVLHEFGHALMARHFGIRTRSITLSPLGGLAQLERMSQKPVEEFWIAIAGPLVNVAIAFVLSLGVIGFFLIDPDVQQTLWWRFLSILLAMNMGLVVFNMLPAFPMDGGRVLRATLACWLGLLQGTRVAVAVGTGVAIFMGLAGLVLLGSPWLFLIAAFVIWAGHQELNGLEMEERRRQEVQRIAAFWNAHLGWRTRESTP